MSVALTNIFYILFPIIIIYLCSTCPIFDKIGMIILCYGVGLVLGNINLLPREYATSVTILAITRRTVMILGSAPGYPHGVVDPIEELGAIALEKNIPLHVDACVGGYLHAMVTPLHREVMNPIP